MQGRPYKILTFTNVLTNWCHVCMQLQHLLYLVTIRRPCFLVLVKKTRFSIKLKKSYGGLKVLTITVFKQKQLFTNKTKMSKTYFILHVATKS